MLDQWEFNLTRFGFFGCFVGIREKWLAEPTGFRTWTDATGKFNVEARLVGFASGAVSLRKKDGKQPLSIPLKRLSAPDQAYVKAWKIGAK